MTATPRLQAPNAAGVAERRSNRAERVDHAFEAIELKTTAEQAFGMLLPGGTETIIGMIPVGAKVELMGGDFLASAGSRALHYCSTSTDERRDRRAGRACFAPAAGRAVGRFDGGVVYPH